MHYVYCDFTDEGEVFYVGKGNSDRIVNKTRNWKHRIVSEEEGFNRAVVFESPTEQECFDKEIELIKEYRSFFRDVECSDNACNFTTGGEGGKTPISAYGRQRCSDMAINTQARRIAEGTHTFLGGDMQREAYASFSQEKRQKINKKRSDSLKDTFGKRTQEQRDARSEHITSINKRRWAQWRKDNGRIAKPDDHLYLT